MSFINNFLRGFIAMSLAKQNKFYREQHKERQKEQKMREKQRWRGHDNEYRQSYHQPHNNYNSYNANNVYNTTQYHNAQRKRIDITDYATEVDTPEYKKVKMKSKWILFFLVFILGPFGLFYASTILAIQLIAVNVVLELIGNLFGLWFVSEYTFLFMKVVSWILGVRELNRFNKENEDRWIPKSQSILAKIK